MYLQIYIGIICLISLLYTATCLPMPPPAYYTSTELDGAVATRRPASVLNILINTYKPKPKPNPNPSSQPKENNYLTNTNGGAPRSTTGLFYGLAPLFPPKPITVASTPPPILAPISAPAPALISTLTPASIVGKPSGPVVEILGTLELCRPKSGWEKFLDWVKRVWGKFKGVFRRSDFEAVVSC